MNWEEFAQHTEAIRGKLYQTAVLYLGDEAAAEEALSEAVYKALRGCKKLRQPEYFDTWITRILLNVCADEHRRKKRLVELDVLPETAVEAFDSLPLREAIARLPQELREIVILRYFSCYTLHECAEILHVPQGTVATRQRRALTLLRLELGEEGRP